MTPVICPECNKPWGQHNQTGNRGECPHTPVSVLLARILADAQRIDHYKNACIATEAAIQQILGKALKYPWYKDDQANFPGATEANGVFVGEHVAETLATEAAQRIEKLEARARWRPISEMHEDFGECILVNVLKDTGYMEFGNNLSLNWDAAKWTHFAQVPLLGQNEYERMRDEAEDAIVAALQPREGRDG